MNEETAPACDGSHGDADWREWPHWHGPYMMPCPATAFGQDVAEWTQDPEYVSGWASIADQVEVKPHDGGPGNFEWQFRPPSYAPGASQIVPPIEVKWAQEILDSSLSPGRFSRAAGMHVFDVPPPPPPHLTWDSVMEDLREIRRNPPPPPPQVFILSEGDQRTLGMDPAPAAALVFTPADWGKMVKGFSWDRSDSDPLGDTRRAWDWIRRSPETTYGWMDEAQFLAATGSLISGPPHPVRLRPRLTPRYLMHVIMSWLRR